MIIAYFTIILLSTSLSLFSPKKDAEIRLYLSPLEEKLLNLGLVKHKNNHVTQEVRQALQDQSILAYKIIK